MLRLRGKPTAGSNANRNSGAEAGTNDREEHREAFLVHSIHFVAQAFRKNHDQFEHGTRHYNIEGISRVFGIEFVYVSNYDGLAFESFNAAMAQKFNESLSGATGSSEPISQITSVSKNISILKDLHGNEELFVTPLGLIYAGGGDDKAKASS